MDSLRLGALLVSPTNEIGLYLSYRIVLTVPEPGQLRAVSMTKFQNGIFFAIDGVALALGRETLDLLESERCYQNSWELLRILIGYDKEESRTQLMQYLHNCFGVKPKRLRIQKLVRWRN